MANAEEKPVVSACELSVGDLFNVEEKPDEHNVLIMRAVPTDLADGICQGTRGTRDGKIWSIRPDRRVMLSIHRDSYKQSFYI
jgi:hypothetical protein